MNMANQGKLWLMHSLTMGKVHKSHGKLLEGVAIICVPVKNTVQIEAIS